MSVQESTGVIRRRRREHGGVSALLWLRSREFLGESRDSRRLILLGAALVFWFAFVILATVQAGAKQRLDPSRDIQYVFAAGWALWALVPLLGGGSEVTSARRLAPYPIGPGTVFRGGWAASLLDVPYLVVGPLMFGLGIAAAGWAGALLVLVFIVGSSATGQLAAWVAFIALTGRKRTGVASLVLTGAVVLGLTFAPALLRNGVQFAEVLPSGWGFAGIRAVIEDRWGAWAGWLALLAAPIPVAVLFGPGLTRAALDREARAGGVGGRSWGRAGWYARSRFWLLIVVSARSVFRSTGAQVGIVAVLAVPALARLPGVDIANIDLIAMGAIAGLAAATVLGVNSFAFDAGGMAATLALPLRPTQIVIAKFSAITGLLFFAQLFASTLGAIVLDPGAETVAVDLVLCAARAALLGGISVCWSVHFPSPSDYDSLRARIAAPISILTFLPAAALCSYFVAQSTKVLPGVSGAVATTLICAMVGLVLAVYAGRELAGAGRERVGTGVTG